MTKETCTRLLAHYEKIGRTEAYENMKAHILKASKFTAEEKISLFKPKTAAKTTTSTTTTKTVTK